MQALDKKVFRDLWHMRGQVLAIALVIASGVAVIVMSLSSQRSVIQTTEAYYERYAFAEVFAIAKRAPLHIKNRIEDIDGVVTVQTRIQRYATLDMPGFAEPVMAQFVSIPEGQQPILNKLVVRQGRLLQPNRPDEIVVSEPFANAHRLNPGDELTAILNGHRRRLSVVGVALSPEFIYSLGPGALMADNERFGVIWMGHKALSAAFDLTGSFNSVSLTLTRNTDPELILPQLDRILEPYGGVGSFSRKDQISNWFVMNEIDQMGTMAKILPTIFLVVSAFLTNMVLGRLIAIERSQIGLMKAFGYSNFQVGWHYTKLVLIIALIGAVFGLLLGAVTGRLNTEMYTDLFRFPLLIYRPSPSAFLIATTATVFCALVGAIGSVRRAALLPPAQAMVPPAPPSFGRTRWSYTRFGQWLDQPSRIVLRHVVREPVRSSLTIGGVACSVALLISALQWSDALSNLGEAFFFNTQRQHVTVGLVEPQGETVVREFEHMPAVLSVEATRVISVDFLANNIKHRGSLTGVQTGAVLRPIFDEHRNDTIPAPPEGLVLSNRLAQKLKVSLGDEVWVHVLQGHRTKAALPVVRLMETKIGMPAYLHTEALKRLTREKVSAEFLSLLVDSDTQEQLFGELKKIPTISSIILRQADIDSFNDTVIQHTMVFITLFSAFACALGFGVAYNAIRIALSERGRELATLRVLGFSTNEVSYILFAEVCVLIVLALPVGCVLGYLLTMLMASAFDTELFRVPLEIQPSTYGGAVLIALGATVLSGLVVLRRLGRLNLIEVLKTRE